MLTRLYQLPVRVCRLTTSKDNLTILPAAWCWSRLTSSRQQHIGSESFHGKVFMSDQLTNVEAVSVAKQLIPLKLLLAGGIWRDRGKLTAPKPFQA